MKLTCPKCGAAIDAAHVNIAADLAQCTACGEVFRASELVEAEGEGSLEQPSGSRIVFTATGDAATFAIPRAGFSKGMIFPAAFAAFWLGFVAVWTVLAAFASLLFALFSIPFWLAGFAMAGGLLNAVLERQRITLGPAGIEIERSRPVLSKRAVIPYADISAIGMENAAPSNPFAAFRQLRRASSVDEALGVLSVPTVSHGVEKTHFAANVSRAEMEWVVGVLSAAWRRRAAAE